MCNIFPFNEKEPHAMCSSFKFGSIWFAGLDTEVDLIILPSAILVKHKQNLIYRVAIRHLRGLLCLLERLANDCETTNLHGKTRIAIRSRLRPTAGNKTVSVDSRGADQLLRTMMVSDKIYIAEQLNNGGYGIPESAIGCP